jgi:predicted alpha/beta superfamily hydrolase
MTAGVERESVAASNGPDIHDVRVRIESTEEVPLRSRFVDQVYRLQVYLPPSYSGSTGAYPVLYLLDSDMSFGMAKDIVSWLIWGREIPEIVIVGIAYCEGTEQWWSKRSRDYSPTPDKLGLWGDWPLAGGASNFASFIEKELIPFVTAEYRVVAGDNTIAGFSFGGLFACYALFNHPGLFARYVIISPPVLWNDSTVMEYERRYSSDHRSLPARVFCSIGGLEDPDKLLEPCLAFHRALEARQYRDLELTTALLEGETHFSGYPYAFTKGVKAVFTAG